MSTASSPAPASGWPSAPDPPELPDGRPRWPPYTGFLAIIAALGAAIGTGLIIGIVGAIAGADISDPPPSISILSTVAQDVCFVGSAILFARMSGTVAPWMFGLRPARVLRSAGWMALTFAVLFGFSQAWSSLLGINGNEKLPKELGVHDSHLALASTAVLVTVIAPIAEEFLFRGYVFPALRNWHGLWPAAIVTGLLFGALHVISAPAEFLVPLALFGFLLCLLYHRTKSLYPCIALHSINNAIAFGASPDIGWSWQIVPVALGALGLIALAALAVRSRFGPAPGLSPV